MDFLKNHYEKVILGVVLLLLAVVAGYLPFEVSNVRSRLTQSTQGFDQRKVDPIPALNLSTNEAVVSRLGRRIEFGFGTGDHGLFNPSGTWRKRPDGRPEPPRPGGVAGLTVTNISPLMLEIKYQGLSQGGGSSARYRFFVKDESSTNRSLVRGRIVIQGPGVRPDVFTIRQVIGPEEDPQQFNLELGNPRRTIAVAKDKGYTEVVGHAADLRHEAESRTYKGQKQGNKLTIGNSPYNVVAVSEADVTIEDDKTKRRTVVPLMSAP